MKLFRKSRAKLNLFLKITGKRADGYHLLESLFTTLDLCDFMEVSDSGTVSCRIIGKDGVIEVENNIVMNVIDALQRKFEINRGAHFEIYKNIPIGSGLGGGSSNAASAMIMLNQLWNLNLSLKEMHDIGITIGADVPFFLYDSTSFIEGIGDIVKPIQNLGIAYPTLLIRPNFDISTIEVYRKSVASFSKSLQGIMEPYFKVNIGASPIPSKMKSRLQDLILHTSNDLEEAATFIQPRISNALELLLSQDGCMTAKLSGSGSVCFGIFDTLYNLDEAKKAFLRREEFEVFTEMLCI